MKKLFLVVLGFVLSVSLFADDFYWVGNSGDWTDFSTHWATSSGGAVMHNRVPDISDVVYFDANSFSETGAVVSVDTSLIRCAEMNWTNVTNEPEIISQSSDSIYIASRLVLSDNMSFNHFGLLVFEAQSTGQILEFDAASHQINAHIEINIPSGELTMLSDLLLPQKQVVIQQGNLNLNSHNFSFNQLNADKDTPIAPTGNAALSNADTITMFESLYFDDLLDVSSLNALLQVNLQTKDSVYLSFGNHTPDIDVIIAGSKKCFLIGPLKTTGNVDVDISGEFYSQDYPIACQSFASDNAFSRTIDLGTSTIQTASLTFSGSTLNLNSASASLVFTGNIDLYYKANNLNLSFSALSIADHSNMIIQSSLNAGNLVFGSASNLLVKDGKTVTVSSLIGNGDCGNFSTLRGYCGTDPFTWPDDNCMMSIPEIYASFDINIDFVKLAYISGTGANFIATDSYDQGNVSGWTITEPSSTNTLYWVGGQGNWSDPQHWSLTSGGAAQTCLPTRGDNVIFDANSFSASDTVFIQTPAYCEDMLWENLPSDIVLIGNADLTIGGDMTLHQNLAVDFQASMIFHNEDVAGENTILTDHVLLQADLLFTGESHYDFADSLWTNSVLSFERGALSFSGNYAEMLALESMTTETRDLNIKHASLVLTGEDACWSVDPTNLSFISDTSEIIFNSSMMLNQDFYGGGLAYDSIKLVSPSCHFYEDNSIGFLSILAGNELILEANSTTSLDSISATASCDMPISISASLSTETAQISKTGHPELNITGVHLSNVTADLGGGAVYNALASTGNGDTSGWTITGSPLGTVYYWLGNTKYWNDISNWETGGLPATCLPGIMDTVVFEESRLLLASTDTVFVQNNRYCRQLDASGTNGISVNFVLDANLEVTNSLKLHNSVSVEYLNPIQVNQLFDVTEGLVIAPNGENAELVPQAADLKVNLYLRPQNEDDTVHLYSEIQLSELAGIVQMSGAFVTNEQSVSTDLYRSTGTQMKHFVFDKSDVEIGFYAEFQDATELTVSADSSAIRLTENAYNSAIFNGGDQQFFDIEMFMSEDGSDVEDYVIRMIGSNHFHQFTVNPGGTLQLQGGSTTTVDSSLNINGTCLDRIQFRSDHAGTAYDFVKTNTYQDTAYSLIVSDMNITASAVAMLSSDDGGNTGWIFDPTQAAIAQFDMPYPACIGESLSFTNQSQSMWGGMDHLEFEWIIENIDTLNTTDLVASFPNQGEFIIHLTATDTLTHCFDLATDTLTLINHTALISASPVSLTICEGENVEFTASSNQTVDYEFYLNGNPVGLGSGVTTYSSTSFNDGDEVYVETVLDGCSRISDTLVVNVNPLPVVSLTSNPADAVICDGEMITFTAGGADLYRFYLDGSPITSMTTDNQFASSVMAHNAVISVEAQMSATGCTAWNTTDITVTVNDNPTVGLVSDIDPAIICAGEEITFTGSGADMYEFFVNGQSQGVASANADFASTTIANGDLVTVEGSSSAGCSTLSSFINVSVNPSPSLAMSSSVVGNEICSGEEIEFTATGAAEYLFFIDDVADGSFAFVDNYVSSAFVDGQTIFVAGRIGDCYDTLSPESVIVHPNIDLVASTEAICPGEEVIFTASGDSQYQFYVNATAVGSLSANPVYSSTSLNNGDVVSVSGTAGACLPEDIQITVHELPVPVFTSSDVDLSICDGEAVSFTASGAAEYEFFVNGLSNGLSTNAIFTTNSLSDGDEITLGAYSSESCFAQSEDSLTFEVLPLPTVNLSTTDPVAICQGDMVSVQASGADLFEFFLNGESLGDPSAMNELSLDTLMNNDVISLVGTSLGCSAAAADDITYAVYGIPVVSIEAITETSVCLGDEISVQASGANEYEFFVNGLSQGAADTNPIFATTSLSDADIITVVGSQNICSDTADNSISVNVNPIPDVILTSNMPETGLCFGDTIELTVSGATEYQLLLDGEAISALSSQTSYELSDYFDGQIISVMGYNNACVRETNSPDTIELNRVFTTLTTTSSGTALCNGNQIDALAGGADEYEFFLDGASVGASSASNTYSFTPQNDGQTLMVIGTDLTNGCSEESPELSFNLQDNPVIEAYPSTSFCENDSVMLSVTHDNGILRWYRNGSLIETVTDDGFYANVDGDYSVEIVRGSENAVYACGNNASGQLGTGNTTQSDQPVPSLMTEAVSYISAGEAFALALDVSGQVYAWGDNAYGALGNGTYSDAYSPVNLPITETVTEVAAGYYHSIAVMHDSTLMAWGKNDMGQLGYGNYAASNFPNAVQDLDQVVAIAAGKNHTLALDVDGKVYAWGNNDYGQLGTGDFVGQNAPVEITSLPQIQTIACGGNHNLAIDAQGRVWTWGANESGQLGLGDQNNRNTPVMLEGLYEVQLIAAGQQHSMAYNQHGKCYVWGSNANNQLGISGMSSSMQPQQLNLSGIAELHTGVASSFAVRNDKSLWAWGMNNAAQLGLGHNNAVETPQQSDHVFGVKTLAAGNEFTSILWEDALVCESDVLNLETLEVPDVEIYQNENILSVDQGIAWQWFLNDSEIPGANSNEITVTAEGDYSVLIEFENACELHTDAVTIGSDVADFISESQIIIAPNPANNHFTIQLDNPNAKLLSYELIAGNSDIVLQANADLEEIISVDVADLAPSVYYLRLVFERQIVVKKIVIQ